MNIPGAITTYAFLPKKPAIKIEWENNNQIALFEKALSRTQVNRNGGSGRLRALPGNPKKNTWTYSAM